MIKTQGRRGEVAAELHTDFPERFEKRRRIFALKTDGGRQELQLESFWPQRDLMVLKFAGVDSISGAEMLVGCELQIPVGERAELEPGSAYVSDLAGCTVFDGEREIGKVADVQFGAGEAPLLIVKGAKEYEIPFAKAYLTSVDVAHKQIRMQLPDGMLDVNAPLTAEEKERQKK